MRFDRKQLLLYGVTDRSWLNGQTLYEQVRQALEGGVSFLQLREKNLSEQAFLEEAKEIQKLCREYKVPFIINDNVDLALEIDADGVHVGQDDMEAGEVRKRLGEDKIIGVSAHSVEEALRAEKCGATYLGSGAVFGSGTKKDVGTLDHEVLKEICAAVQIPVVAIGGISRDNILQLKGTGIDGVAVISAADNSAAESSDAAATTEAGDTAAETEAASASDDAIANLIASTGNCKNFP